MVDVVIVLKDEIYPAVPNPVTVETKFVVVTSPEPVPNAPRAVEKVERVE